MDLPSTPDDPREGDSFITGNLESESPTGTGFVTPEDKRGMRSSSPEVTAGEEDSTITGNLESESPTGTGFVTPEDKRGTRSSSPEVTAATESSFHDINTGETQSSRIPAEQLPISCLVHLGGLLNEPLKSLTPELFMKVQLAADQRRNMATTKYSNVLENLPEEWNISMGYHRSCYSNFTAVKLVQKQSTEISPCFIPERRPQRKTFPEPTDPNAKCVFCNKNTTVKNSKRFFVTRCSTAATKALMLNAAIAQQDIHVATKLQEDLTRIYFHHPCRNSYLHLAKRSEGPKTKAAAKGTSVEDVKRDAYRGVAEFVKQEIIMNQKPSHVEDLYDIYKQLYQEKGGEEQAYSQRYLLQKLQEEFPDLHAEGFSKRSLVFNSLANPATLLENFRDRPIAKKEVEACARVLRQQLLAVQKREIGIPVTAESLAEGEGRAPDIVQTFFRNLYCGPDPRRAQTEAAQRRVKSACDDALFNVSAGKVAPAKHILLSMGLKTMTRSRKVVTVLNRFGHCVSDQTGENFVNQLYDGLPDSDRPSGVILNKNLTIGFAHDNYDELTHTLSGAGSVHDTTGIAFQDLIPETSQTTPRRPAEDIGGESDRGDLIRSLPPERARTIKTRRSVVRDQLATVYPAKRRRVATCELKKTVLDRPESDSQSEKHDHMWILALHSLLSFMDVPMWKGFNSIIPHESDMLPVQKISYLRNIPQPPTSDAVVMETVRISKKIARECGKDVTLITYDLGIAKRAYELLIDASTAGNDVFDGVFIMMGTFHLSCTFFAAVGKLIEGSGAPSILMDELIAPGSINGVLSGKHFYRAERAHTMFMAALRMLHFQKFVDTTGNVISADLTDVLMEIVGGEGAATLNHAEMDELLSSYEDYLAASRTGLYGENTKFWTLYTDLVADYLRFSRSIRTNDVDLFIYSLVPLIRAFFATNHSNYARWTTFFHWKLTDMDDNVRRALEKGGLSVKRTHGKFNRNHVDMTLEQTVNKDAASRSTGVVHLTSSGSGRAVWFETRGQRAAIVSALMEQAGCQSADDAHKEVTEARKKKDSDDLRGLIACIRRHGNPFDVDCSVGLRNLSTGRVAAPDVKDFLLNFSERGEEMRVKFLEECEIDPQRLLKPIKRQKIINFAHTTPKSKSTNPTLKELKSSRNLLGRLLVLSEKRRLNLEEVMSFPLLPVPLCFADYDGAAHKTQKSKLFDILIEQVPTCSSSFGGSRRDVAIVDAGFFLHTRPQTAATFGRVARDIIVSLSNRANEVHFICDTYPAKSIKNAERLRRGDEEFQGFLITGPDQKCPNWQKAMRSAAIKTVLPAFLAEEWSKPELRKLIEGEVFLAYDNRCIRFTSEGADTVEELACEHEEADTRIFFHAVHAHRNSPGRRIVVNASDTDILIIFLGNMDLLDSAEVWMESGIKAINISELHKGLPLMVSRALPAFHAFTGCDFNPTFFRKGKQKPLKILQNFISFQDAFAGLGEREDVPRDIESAVENYVCKMYGIPGKKSMGAGRSYLLWKSFRPKEGKHPFSHLRGVEANSLPPSGNELQTHLKRTNYIAYTWKHAQHPVPHLPGPENHGWIIDNVGMMNFEWFTGPQFPPQFDDLNEGEVPEEVDDEEEEPSAEEQEDDEEDTVSEFL